MSRFAAPFTALTLALALGTTGCGEAKVDNTDAGDATSNTNEYLPLAVGNWWIFKVTDNDGVTIEKTTTVVEEQKVGGSGPNADLDAFFVRTTKKNSETEDKTESWQGTVEFEEGQFATVRYREIAYHAVDGSPELEEHWNPYKLRVDNFHVEGDGWDEVYTETKRQMDVPNAPSVDSDQYDIWGVQSDAASIMVPAGTFTAKSLVRQATNTGDPDKLYWFVKGIGKVQETGSQVEQLVDCYVGGKTCAEILAAQ